MPAIGQTLSHFRLEDLLGRGGMGEVYRAKDLTLGRDVALKVLPEEFTSDPDRVARFQREAKLLASLNHPNIAAIYGLEESGGTSFLILELVEGETISDQLRRRPIAVEESLNLAQQIAEALEAAHEKGIIHRDLKPANIKVTPEGKAKVLDFGLAKAFRGAGRDQNASQAVTATDLGTELGQIVGTPAYMSPEQARGRLLDQRTDVWAFGCVMFELLTGKKAFGGETFSDTIAAILEREPAWETLPRASPAKLRDLLRRCLQKDANLRVQEMRDVLAEIREIRSGRQASAFKKAIFAFIFLFAVAGAIALMPGVRHFLLDLMQFQASQQEKHLAVIPFLNIGNDPVNQVFCDGLVESLTSNLNQLERFHDSLRVVPSTEVRRQSVASASDAKRSFAVNLAVTGSVQRTGDEIRVTVNLVDARTLRQLGSREIKLRREDLSKMEDQLPDLVAELLDLQLLPQARTALKTGSTRISDAYDAYLRGRGYLRRYDKEGNLKLAVAAFKDALQRDSRYALAYAGLGEAYWRNFDRTKNPEWLELAQEANARAIELSERLAPAHVNSGMTYVSSGRYDIAVQEFQRALEIDSLNPDAYRELGSAYEAMNKIKDAEATYKRALQLRPNDWLSNNRLGGFYYRHGQYGEAEPLFRKVIALTPDNSNGYSNLGGLYVAWGRHDQAESLLKKAIEVKPTDPRGYSNLGTLYFQRGQYGKAVPMFEQAVAKGSGPNYIWYGNLADAYRWAPGFESKAGPAYQRAIELAEQQLAINPNHVGVLSSAALYRAKLGQKDRALHDITLARRLAPADTTVAFNAVVVIEILGRRADALAVLGQLLKGGLALHQIECEPELNKLRQDPAFIRMVSHDAAGNALHTQPK
jgi:eukaryotic-like serine/threonine-protein kinase